MLLHRQCATGSLAVTTSTSEGEADIPTIVLRPELAIQTLDMFSRCPTNDASCCAGLPVLKAANIDSSTSSQTILYGLDERKRNKKRRQAAYASATVIKTSQDEALGVGLKKVHGVIQISSLRPGCLLSEAPFKVEDKLISINNVDCSQKNLSCVASMLKKATGLLTVVVEHPDGDPKLVESMIMKESPSTKTGLGVAPASGQQIMVSSINPTGIFASSLLSRRDTILVINGVFCDQLQNATEAARLIFNAERVVTVLAERRPGNAAVVAQAA